MARASDPCTCALNLSGIPWVCVFRGTTAPEVNEAKARKAQVSTMLPHDFSSWTAKVGLQGVRGAVRAARGQPQARGNGRLLLTIGTAVFFVVRAPRIRSAKAGVMAILSRAACRPLCAGLLHTQRAARDRQRALGPQPAPAPAPS